MRRRAASRVTTHGERRPVEERRPDGRRVFLRQVSGQVVHSRPARGRDVVGTRAPHRGQGGAGAVAERRGQAGVRRREAQPHAQRHRAHEGPWAWRRPHRG